jgi:hypothetical protein
MKALLAVCVLGLGLAACDKQGDCSDGGGVWAGEPGRCICTDEARGTYSDTPTASQLKTRELCAQKPNGSDWSKEDIEELP